VTTVSTAVCGWFQDILEGAGCAVAGLWDDLPVDPQRFAEAGPSLGWDDFARLCERFEQRFDGREALLAATRRTAQAYYEAGARVFTGGFGDPRQLYWVAHRWVRPAAFPAFTSEFRDLPNGQIHITLAGPVDASVPAFVFEMIQAALVDVPRLIGQPAANVTAHLAPGRADYTIAWAVGPVDDAHLREMLDQRITAHGGDLIAQIDDDGVFRYVSPNLKTVLGYASQQLIGRNASEFLRTGDSPDLWRRLAEYLSEPGSSGMRIRAEHADGTPRWFDITGRRAPREDDSVRFVLVARDITEQKVAQQESEEWRERYEVAIRASNRLVYDWNLAAGNVEFRGEGDHLGFALEAGGRELWDCLVDVDDDVRDRFRDGLTRAIGAGTAFHLEYAVRPGTLEEVLVENDAYPLFDQDGKIRHVTGFVNDITHRHDTEEALRVSEARYRIVSELTSDYAFSVRVGPDASMHREWITEAFERITGYRPDEMSEEEWKDLVHPDDHAKRIGQFSDALTNGHATHEYRIIRNTGEVRTMREHTRVIHNEDGTLHWYGACRDITEQTDAELARRFTDERFSAIAQSSYDIIGEFDQTGKALYISPNVAGILGIPPDEIVSKNRLDLVHPDDRRQLAHHLEHDMDSGESKNLIFRMRNGDGVWRFMETTATR